MGAKVTDLEFRLASLGVRAGGLGIIDPVQVHASAFVGSGFTFVARAPPTSRSAFYRTWRPLTPQLRTSGVALSMSQSAYDCELPLLRCLVTGLNRSGDRR